MKRWMKIGFVILLLIIMMGSFTKTEKEKNDQLPDAINGLSINRDQYLTVIANCDEITDEKAFAELLIRMCKENSFYTIKFSTDKGYPTSVNMRVYLRKEDMEKEPRMTVKYEPSEYGRGYDIVHDAEQFYLFIDGKMYE